LREQRDEIFVVHDHHQLAWARGVENLQLTLPFRRSDRGGGKRFGVTVQQASQGQGKRSGGLRL
jgi:hypothetical protein